MVSSIAVSYTHLGPKIADIQQRRDALMARFADKPNPNIAYCAQLGALCGSRLPAEEIYRRRYELVGVFLRERVDSKPVSYPHLDVYKRQGGNRDGCTEEKGFQGEKRQETQLRLEAPASRDDEVPQVRRGYSFTQSLQELRHLRRQRGIGS